MRSAKRFTASTPLKLSATQPRPLMFWKRQALVVSVLLHGCLRRLHFWLSHFLLLGFTRFCLIWLCAGSGNLESVWPWARNGGILSVWFLAVRRSQSRQESVLESLPILDAASCLP